MMNNNFEVAITLQAIQQNEVSHLLHLFLSLITFGIWIPVWILVTISASIEQKRLSLKLKKLMNQE